MFLVMLLMVYTFRSLLGLLESAIMLQTSTLEINGPQHEKMYLWTFVLVLANQSHFECMMFLEYVSLYLTKLFQLFCEL